MHDVNCTVTEADTTMVCATKVGVGGNFSWAVEVGEQRSALSDSENGVRSVMQFSGEIKKGRQATNMCLMLPYLLCGD